MSAPGKISEAEASKTPSRPRPRPRPRSLLFESGGYSGTTLPTRSRSSAVSSFSASAEPILRSPFASFDQVREASPSPISPSRPSPTNHHRRQSSSMNYQNFLDNPQSGGQPSNARQAPPSPSQGLNHTNGMNGAMGIGGMTGIPTPAGHQQDLNYVMGMVEELSRTLEENRRLTESIVEKVGQVRERAKTMNLTNDELIAMVAAEVNEGSTNIEKENSELRKALDKSERSAKRNWDMVLKAAGILEDILEKMHNFKAKNEADTLRWHKSYREQLEWERAENLRLRCEIYDKMGHAAEANEWLRKARRQLTDWDRLNELTIQNVALRQEKRFWKRMAMPMIPDDDPEWSDDDDLISEKERKRLAPLIAEREAENAELRSGGL